MHNGVNKIDFILKTMDNDKIPISCNNCSYEWQYGGEKRGKERATCPSCGNKTRIDNGRMDTPNND